MEDVDILINDYSTNDMHLVPKREPNATQLLEERQLEALQNFTRFVLQRNDLSRHCVDDDEDDNNKKKTTTTTTKTATATTTSSSSSSSSIPQILYLHLNDYLGNAWRQILGGSILTRVNSVLAPYYGYASASYADVVRDYVYGDTHESFFTSRGWYETKNKGKMSGEGM